ncbi:hypothetical protein GPECTOR_50g577 [Gonium pectorale]|uniref:Uncharacterized protein n=1 Tax=Gonium pectorale TaxID=33097 RepID=A0A150G7H0_GONPE|nr:hypothetical protein GPECTOR_50g577 [Gonium pectorale]|eukprot:KXZ45784.1 hypothetical protein GPECTOR_50g577 [Gonium pectorale]
MQNGHREAKDALGGGWEQPYAEPGSPSRMGRSRWGDAVQPGAEQVQRPGAMPGAWGDVAGGQGSLAALPLSLDVRQARVMYTRSVEL